MPTEHLIETKPFSLENAHTPKPGEIYRPGILVTPVPVITKGHASQQTAEYPAQSSRCLEHDMDE
jgi:hypothetical protein